MCASQDKGSVATCGPAALELALAKIMEVKGCGLLGSEVVKQKQQCIDPAAEARNRIQANSTATDAVNKAIGLILASHTEDLRIAYEAEVLFNKTRDEKVAKLAGDTDIAIQKATLDAGQKALAAGNDEKAIQALLDAAKVKKAASAAALAKALKKYEECLASQKADNTVDCIGMEDAYFKVLVENKVDTEVVKTYKVSLENTGLTDAEKQAKVNAAKNNVELLKGLKNAQAEEVEKIEKKIVSKKCNADSEDAACIKLLTDLTKAKLELADLIRQLDEAKKKFNNQNSAVAASESEDEGGSPIAIIAAVAAVVVLCIIGAVAYVMIGGKGDGANKNAGDRSVASDSRLDLGLARYCYVLYGVQYIDLDSLSLFLGRLLQPDVRRPAVRRGDQRPWCGGVRGREGRRRPVRRAKLPRPQRQV